MILDKYPRTDLHELNLDWLLRTVQHLQNTVENLNVDEIIKELIEDGTIYDHFGLYFSRYYKNYADMMADEELQNDMFVFCFGAANPFDGGECYFHIIDTSGDALTCQNGLYAYPAHHDEMSVAPYYFITMELGAAINMMQTKGIKKIYVPSDLGSATITTEVNLTSDLEVANNVQLTLDAPIRMHGATLRGGQYFPGANLATQSMIILQENTNTVDEVYVEVNANGKIGIGCMDGKGIITECHLDGQDTGMFGIWGEQAPADYTMDIRECTIERFYLNGLFTEARSCLVSGCTFRKNHVQTIPTGGGQLCLKGGNTQGYNEVMNCQIIEPGGTATSGIELWLSGNAIIHGNYIENKGSQLDAIAVQAGCFADIYDNTMHGDSTNGVALHLYGNYAKVNTHDNWYAQWPTNIKITDATQSGAVKEKRFTGDLLDITSAVKPIFDVEGSWAYKAHVASGSSFDFKMYEDDILTIIDMTTGEMRQVFATVAGNYLIDAAFTHITLTAGSGQINLAVDQDTDVFIYRS